MKQYSTREAARMLGVSMATINRYVAAGTIPLPRLTRIGGVKVRLWTRSDIAKAKAVIKDFTDGRRNRRRKTNSSKRGKR